MDTIDLATLLAAMMRDEIAAEIEQDGSVIRVLFTDGSVRTVSVE